MDCLFGISRWATASRTGKKKRRKCPASIDRSLLQWPSPERSLEETSRSGAAHKKRKKKEEEEGAMKGVGQVGRIGCLLAMAALCATRVASASRHGNTSNNNHQGVVGKSRLIKTDPTSINQQDQNQPSMAATKGLPVGSSGKFSTQSPPLRLILTATLCVVGTGEKRVRKRSKWMQSTTSSGPSSSASHQPAGGNYFNKDGTFLKRIVTEVIAERDAQIAAALFEVAKNQPHLQMMVQTVRIPSLP